MHGNILADLFSCDDFLVEHRRRTGLEPVVPLLRHAHIRRDVVSHQRRFLLGNDGHVHIATGTQIVPDTGLNRLCAQLHSVILGHVSLPLGLEDRHGSQRTRTHGDVGQLIGGAMGVNGEKMTAGGVNAGNDQVCADVALVAEEVLLQHRHARYYPRLAAGGEAVQLEVGGDDGGGKLCVGGGTGSGTPDLGGDVVQLLAVLQPC
jgi:hypothetical protein